MIEQTVGHGFARHLHNPAPILPRAPPLPYNHRQPDAFTAYRPRIHLFYPHTPMPVTTARRQTSRTRHALHAALHTTHTQHYTARALTHLTARTLPPASTTLPRTPALPTPHYTLPPRFVCSAGNWGLPAALWLYDITTLPFLTPQFSSMPY